MLCYYDTKLGSKNEILSSGANRGRNYGRKLRDGRETEIL